MTDLEGTERAAAVATATGAAETATETIGTATGAIGIVDSKADGGRRIREKADCGILRAAARETIVPISAAGRVGREVWAEVEAGVAGEWVEAVRTVPAPC